MSDNQASKVGLSSAPATRNSTLRWLGVAIFALLITESAVGGPLVSSGSPYPAGYLWAHIGLAAFLVLITGAALAISIRLPSWRARGSAGLTFLLTLGAVISGSWFLVVGVSNGALEGMEGFATGAILISILLIVWGAVKVTGSPSISPPVHKGGSS